MKIQYKLLLGLSFLFVLIVVIAGAGLWSVQKLSADARMILDNNDQSLQYVKSMLSLVHGDSARDIDSVAFERFLRLQEANITEAGEQELTQQLRTEFEHRNSAASDGKAGAKMRGELLTIMSLNMQALERKSSLAQSSAHTASNIIAATSSLCIILALVMLVNLPRTLSKPIRELREGIRQISAKNYATRLRMERNDEFRDIANAFNLLAVQLGEYYSSSISTIMTEKKRVETLVNAMRDPVLILDEQRTILFVNDIASRILGMESSELNHRSATDLALRNDLLRSMLSTALPPTMEPETSPHPQSMKVMAGGEEQYYDVEHRRLELPSDTEKSAQYLGDVIILRNVTSYKEHDVAKSSFMATVSHELKTPLSSIRLSLQLLRRLSGENAHTEQEQLLSGIEDDCARLSKISSELLSISQSETGNITLAVQACDAVALAQYALNSVKNLAEQKHQELSLNVQEPIEPMRADAEKVTWVLINFLTNAIRYSPEFSHIVITLQRSGASIQCSVQDQGRGIDERYRERIFDRYFQVPGSSKSGSGLGLAISREFIEALGGEIGLESELGLGSTFWFRLPIGKATR